MSGVPTPSEATAAGLDRYVEFRDSVRRSRLGSGGEEVCLALTSELDEAIRSLVPEMERTGDAAVVATGGFGRSELSPFSDVDLMVLHELDDPAETAGSVFRPLWDSGLRLGHAVRTIKEAGAAARERVDTHTTLLTTRLITGSDDIYGRFVEEIAAVTKARPLTRFLVTQEEARRAESPYLLMATDVKAGRGGLRTLHGFQWERHREELIGRFSPKPGADERRARESLLRIRNALHAITGRHHDVFSPDLRESVADWLGMGSYQAGEMLVEALLITDRLTSERWSELTSSAGKGRLVQRARSRLSRRPPTPRPWDTAEGFVSMLESGEAGRARLEALHGSGALATVLPEWERVRSAPQLAPFHEHPVESHLWRTCEEMKNLIEGSDPHFGSIASEVGSRQTLILSAFLHDIGKGQGGDHSQRGCEIARLVCERLGCSPTITSLVSEAARLHLLLSQAATRRDLDDPAVIDDVAAAVGQLPLLQVLYLLTVADSRATGPTMWNTWKATLVRTLFLRCAARFGADKPTSTHDEASWADVLASHHDRIAAQDHMDAMPSEYLRSAPEDVAWHLDLIQEMQGRSHLGVRSEEAADSAVVVGMVGPGFRLMVAESLAANGVDVLEARLHTRSDGMVVDTFHVRDDITGGRVSPERWERVRSDIDAAVSGRLDTESKVAARAAAYKSGQPEAFDPEVDVSVDSATGDAVVSVRCADRVGRLAGILSALFECGLEIRLAKLDSTGGELMDVFYVKGALADDPATVRRLEHRIAGLIEP